MKPTKRLSNYSILMLAGLLAAAPMGAQEPEQDPAWDVSDIPGEARQIAIDTDNGTWMSLDVSPDGSTIAFDMLGDIYLLPVEGGDARAIHSGLSWSMQPRFSPDGKEIAFISDAGGGDNVWIMQADGSDAEQLTDESFRLLNNPYWSPDGDWIAARKHFTTQRSLGTGEIWLYHRNGGGGVAVVERPGEAHQKELGEPAFSPDGRYIYFALDRTPGATFQYAQDSNATIFEIRRHDLQTGKVDTVVSGAGGSVRPTPSPDGKQLAFVRRVEGQSTLFVKDLASGSEKPLYGNLDKDLQEVWAVHGAYPNMDWMPDSQSIVFWSGGGIRRVAVDSGSVEEIPFRVNDTRAVYDAPRPRQDVAPASFDTRMVRNVAVSPDGTRVVFETNGKLYSRELPDGRPSRLTSDDNGHFEHSPTWSRDGKTVAFVAWNDQSLGQIRSVRARGGRSKVLSQQPGHFVEPRFSPDGETIVYRATSGGFLTSPEWSMDTGIFRIPANGGAASKITDDGTNPHFGKASDRLFLTRSGNGARLVSVDVNGEAEQTHATGEYVSRFEVSPDESHLAYRENYHVYVIPMPPGGKAPGLGTTVNSLPMVRATADGGNYPQWNAAGDTLYWSLGPTLFSARTVELFASEDNEGEGGYEAPTEGDSLSMKLDADVPSGTVALTGARILTMAAEDGGVIENGVVIVENNRIKAVGGAGTEIPAGAKTLDASGKTIIPGLIDAHAHGSAGVGFIPQQNWMQHATLALGVTTVHDPSNDSTEIFAAAEMQRTGAILAPRIFSTGFIVYGAKSPWFAEIDSLDDARAHVRRLKAQGAMSIKNYNQPRREQRQQVTTAAREEGMLVVSEGGSLFHMDLSMVADGNSTIEHNLPQSKLYDDVLQFWGQTNVAYTPTLVVTYGGLTAEHYWYARTNVWEHPILSRFVPPHILRPASVRRVTAPESEYHHTVAAATARDLSRQGVMVSIGAHGQREGLASHWEIWGFAQGGMTPLEALKTATITPARALGYDKDLGSIEPGKLADLVVIDSNPLEDIYSTDQVTHVMLNGRLYESSTLKEVLTGDRAPQPFYWQSP